jgi:hypothetical protein
MVLPLPQSFKYLFAQNLTLVVGAPREKRPYAHPDTHGWWAFRTVEELSEVHAVVPACNYLLDTMESGLVQVDPDSTEAMEWARANGLTSKGAWVLHSARGVKALYRAPDVQLPSAHTDGTHATADIGGRLCMIPPSVHPSGLQLRWALGHGPADIPYEKLTLLPQKLLEAWTRLKGPTPPVRPHSTLIHTPHLAKNRVWGNCEPSRGTWSTPKTLREWGTHRALPPS